MATIPLTRIYLTENTPTFGLKPLSGNDKQLSSDAIHPIHENLPYEKFSDVWLKTVEYFKIPLSIISVYAMTEVFLCRFSTKRSAATSRTT